MQAARHDWRLLPIAAGPFEIAAFLPLHPVPAPHLTVYIEGDGFAWVTNTRPSDDPTPITPLALQLALAQPEGNAASLARPCQYTAPEATACSSRYWTEQRFASEVIAAMDQAVTVLKKTFAARELTLVGYSGGAAVAALVAAKRNDVIRLITVAGMLDHRAWTAYHRISPLTGSLNPVDARGTLHQIRQWHFFGGKDRIIPPMLLTAYRDALSDTALITLREEPEYDHHCCWVRDWPQLWRQFSGEGRQEPP